MPFTRILAGMTAAQSEQVALTLQNDGAVVERYEDEGTFALRFTYSDAALQGVAPAGQGQPPAQPVGGPIPPVIAPAAASTPWTRLIGALRATTDLTASQKIALLSQCIEESGRGSSQLAMQHRNFLGMKYRARMEGFATPVDYFASDGEGVYCHFSSEEACIKGYWHFIGTGPYEGWEAFKSDAAGYIRHIAPKYAGNPNYVQNVLGLFEEAAGLLGLAGAPGPTGTMPSMAGLLRLAVVVGHNSVSQGATAVSPISRSEFNFNNVVADGMVLEGPHYNLLAKRFNRVKSSGYTAEISSVYQEVDAWGAECALELHFNSLNPQSTGTEILHASGSVKGAALGLRFVSELKTLLDLPIRHGNGLKPLQSGDRGYSSVVASAVPTILVEPFFGSNSGDCMKMATVGEAALARAYLRAVRDWATADATN